MEKFIDIASQTTPLNMPANDAASAEGNKPHSTRTTREEQVKGLFINTESGKKSCDWYTPPRLLTPLYAANDNRPFDLDPCSPCKGDEAPVRALQHFTITDDGLAQEWDGRVVFLNPPFHSIGRWVEKAAGSSWCRHMPDAPTEASANRDHPLCETVVAVIPARTHTRYWQKYVRDHARVFFISGKISFLKGVGGKGVPVKMPFPEGLAIVIWGNHTAFTDYLNALPASVLDICERSAPVIPDHPVRYWNSLNKAS